VVKPFKENPDRSVLLVGEITQESLSDLIPPVMRLDGVKHRDGIHLYITSPGGAGTAGLALYDFLKTRKNDITIIAHGECSSVAALILQAADRRILSPHTRMLLHFGMVDMEAKGNVGGKAMQTASNEVLRLDETFLDILCERATASRTVLRSVLEAESFLHTNDILHLGLADEVTYTPTYLR
jgi:ATP-dependent Clp protease protease subunit